MAEASDILQDAKEIVEDTVDLAEDTVEVLGKKTVETVDVLRTSFFSRRPVQLALVGVVAAAAGAGIAYLVLNQKLESKYKKITDEQVASVKERYSVLRKEGEHSDLASLAAKYPPVDDSETPTETAQADAIITAAGYRPYNEVPPQQVPGGATAITEIEDKSPEPDIPVVNLFESDHHETYWDWEEERQRRAEHPDEPYLITLDEFNLNEPDYSQIQLTYYEGDEVLADDRDQPIPDETATVGPDALIRFGHGSKDRNIVFVCNPRLEVYFEIIRNNSKYSEQVLGFQHSNPVRKFRMRD